MRSSFLPKCKHKITYIQGFLPTKQTKIVDKKKCQKSPKNHQKKCYDPCLFGRAEILVIFCLHFGRNDDLINSFWIYLTFRELRGIPKGWGQFGIHWKGHLGVFEDSPRVRQGFIAVVVISWCFWAKMVFFVFYIILFLYFL